MSMNIVRRSAVLALAGSWLVPVHAATYVVNNAGDGSAPTDCAGGGTCTLRAAIEAANARNGADRIEFALPNPSTITPLTVLPAVLDLTIIDARPDPDYDGRPQVLLNGGSLSSAYGLVIAGAAAGSSDVYGLGFHDWDAAGLLVLDADGVIVDGCEFGFNSIGSLRGNAIGIHVSSDINTIGQFFLTGVDGPVGVGNTIVGSTGAGILVTGDDNRLRGNTLGTFVASSGNGSGIHVIGNGNQVGGGPGNGSSNPVGNQVWYSDGDGIRIEGNDNRVLANRVGVNASGDDRPNGGHGIVVAGTGNQVGGDGGFDGNRVAYNDTGILLGAPAAATGTEVLRNDVHANRGTGMRVQAGTLNLMDRNRSYDNGTSGVGDGIRVDGDDNVLSRNRVGVDGANRSEGIFVHSAATGNFIGPDNLVGNNHVGIKIEGPGNTVTANSIGTAAAGNAAGGLWLTIGANQSLLDLNRVDGNASHGIRVDSDDNDLLGNLVGLQAGNANAGVLLGSGANGNLVQDNVIGNNLDGVLVQGATNRVEDNFIGVLPDGGDAGNLRFGVHAEAGATGILIHRNSIEGNASTGVLVNAPNAHLCGNLIGGTQGASGELAGRGNGGNGVSVASASGVKVGDGCPSGNLIVFNAREGVRIAGASNTFVAYNRIAANAFGGVGLFLETNNSWIEYNGIENNALEAIFVSTSGDDDRNRIRGNRMRGNASGIDLDGDGPSANDPGDADEGPNRMQNTPVLLFNAAAGDSGLEVGYSVDSATANAAYPLQVEVFAGDGASPTVPSHEGLSSLGSGTYAAPGVDTVTVARPPAGTRWLLATATDANGNTSEFSGALLWVDAAPVSADIFRSGFESEAPPALPAGLRASRR